jgi:TIR domain
MPKITVSYRRGDSAAITGRIVDRLVAHYGADSVFRDIDNIPPGIDYRKYISGALASADILLAIVGPQWAGKTLDGNTRIQEASDLVRIEVETALQRDIPVVPVLVSNATMPRPSDLPDGLHEFAYRNAVKVDALEDFDDHMARLMRDLDRLLQCKPPSAVQQENAGITGEQLAQIEINISGGTVQGIVGSHTASVGSMSFGAPPPDNKLPRRR